MCCLKVIGTGDNHRIGWEIVDKIYNRCNDTKQRVIYFWYVFVHNIFATKKKFKSKSNSNKIKSGAMA